MASFSKKLEIFHPGDTEIVQLEQLNIGKSFNIKSGGGIVYTLTVHKVEEVRNSGIKPFIRFSGILYYVNASKSVCSANEHFFLMDNGRIYHGSTPYHSSSLSSTRKIELPKAARTKEVVIEF